MTVVVLDRMPLADQSRSDIKVLRVAGSDIVATIPRYEAFTHYSRWLATQDVNFREIAGNRQEFPIACHIFPMASRNIS